MAVQRSWIGKRLVLIPVGFSLVIGSFMFLSSCGSSDAKTIPSTTSAAGSIDLALVKKLYVNKCGICHGSDGKMNYAGAKDLSISAIPRAEVVAQITYGKGTMPPMEKQLTAEQIEAVADYTITLREQ